MKNVILKIQKNERVGNDIYLMRLTGDTSDIKNPGEFINITVPGYYLRRPISVHRFSNNYVEILYKVLGNGTLSMSTFPVGMELDCLVGLGNGFDITKSKKPLLVAGGIGIAPMFGLIDEFNKLGIKPTLVYGCACKGDLVLLEELENANDYTSIGVYTGLIKSSMNPMKNKQWDENIEYYESMLDRNDIPHHIKRTIRLKLEEAQQDKYLGLVKLDSYDV